MSTNQAQDRQDERAASSVVVERIRDRLDELLQGWTTHETQWVPAHAGDCPSPHLPVLAEVVPLLPAHAGVPVCSLCGWALLDGVGQRLGARALDIDHAPLLTQLHNAIVGSTAGVNASAGGFDSRPTHAVCPTLDARAGG